MHNFFLGSDFRPSNVVELLRWRALHQPDVEAYTFLTDEHLDSTNNDMKGVTWTYGEIDRRARAIGARLQSLGVSGERALLLYPPGQEYTAGVFGCLYGGNTVLPVFPPQSLQSLHNLQAIAKDAETNLILTTSSFRAALEPLLANAPDLQTFRWVNTDDIPAGVENDWREPDLSSSSLALLCYTSGTTGSPKGIMLTHDNLVSNFRLVAGNYPFFSSRTRSLTWIPAYHNSGLWSGVLQPLYCNYPSVVMSAVCFLQSPPRWLRALSRYKITLTGGPNFAYDLCVRHATPELIAELDLSGLETAFTGTEHIRLDSVNRFAETFKSCGFRREVFFAAYGLTEACLIVASGFLSSPKKVTTTALGNNQVVESTTNDGDEKLLLSCGDILQEQRVVIVNPETFTECAPEQIGEIWVSGASVAPGYWRRPDKTESTFSAFIADTGEGPFLRTGDLGFLLGRELFVTGRLKELIIIRGHNHYPQDIETTIEQCHSALVPGGGAAFAVEAGGEERLAVVQEVKQSETVKLDVLVELIRQAIAENHLIQVHAVQLVREGSIPRTGTQKIQRHACRVRFLAGSLDLLKAWQSDSTAGIETSLAPQTERLDSAEAIEAWLIAWMTIKLGGDSGRIDKTQPVTRYEMDSLRAIELAHAIEANCRITFPMWILLQGPSIVQLAAQIVELQKQGTGISKPIAASAENTPAEYPLSRGQQALWFVHQLAPDNVAYNVPGAVRLHGEINLPALRRSFQILVDRHDSLRTTFTTSHGQPLQRIHEHMDVFFQEEDATTWNEELLKARLVECTHSPFDLEQGPLLRLFLFRESAQQHVLLYVVHHIVCDMWSLALLMDELRVLYTAQTNGSGEDLPPIQLRYSDFVRWQEEMLGSAEGENLWEYWRKQLSGELPVLNLLTDHPRQPVQTYRGATHSFHIDTSLTKSLNALGQNNEATLYVTLLAAFQLLLHRYTGQEDILVGSLSPGRGRVGMAPLVGYLVNPLVLRTDFSQHQTFAQLLGQVRQTVLDAFKHEDYPFALLVERLQRDRDPSRSALFQSMFVLQKAPLLDEQGLASFALGEPGVFIKLGELDVEPVPLEQRAAQFDLTLMMAETEDGLAAAFEYNTDLFELPAIEHLTSHFQTLLNALIADPNCSVARLPLASKSEQQQLLEWSHTSTSDSVEECLHQRFEAQVERTPDAVAVVFQESRMSYRELNERANQVAHYLRGIHIGPDVLVGLLVERSIEMVIGLLGVLKAGGAYVPLDPAYPIERLTFMLKDAQVPVVLTQQRLVETCAVAELPAKIVRLDTDWELISKESRKNPTNRTRAENAAYVIYTSGSTGRPKGVVVQHRAVVNFTETASIEYALNPGDRVLQFASFSFDTAVEEIFPTLTAGATLVLRADTMLSSASTFFQNVQELAITVLDLPTAYWHELAANLGREAVQIPSSLRLVIIGGEKAGTHQLAMWQTHVGSRVRLVNTYGPTEATVVATMCDLSNLLPKADSRDITIGRAIRNVETYILDRYLQPLPINVPGQLYVGGVGVARGYLNRPDLTAEKFIPSPFDDERGRRLYATGDLARYLPGGQIEFLGRIDHQVKLRGFRIELGEIESALDQHPSVRGNIVIALESRGGHKRLVDYVVIEPDHAVSTTELRDFLKHKLPEHMIPGTFVKLRAWPLTPTGKIDRRALPAPDDARLETEGPLAAPRSPVEQEVAAIWTEVLGLGQVDIHENFFNLGGHSLLAMQLIARVRETLHVELPVRKVFESPTVATLSDAVVTALQAERPLQMLPIKRASRDAEMPLSYAQQRLWFLAQLETDSHPYNMPGAVRLTGRLNVDALARSLNEIARRHEILRTTFVTRRDQPWQIIAPTLDVSLPVTDLQDLSETARETVMRLLISEEARQPFDLAKGPLFRTSLLKTGEEDHVMLFTMHHIISDGWSMGVLIREVSSLYQAYFQADESPLTALPVQYADFAVWQQQCMQKEAMQVQLAYWREQLQDSPPLLELPTDYPRPAIQSFRGANLPIAFSESLSNALTALSRQEGVTIFMTLLAAFNALLSRYTGQEDINIGTPIAGRTQVELEGLIGFFVNTLVLRTDLSGDPTFAELLARVRGVALAAYAHQDFPFEKLVEELQPQRNLNRTPFFQVMFVMQNAPTHELRLPGLELAPLEVPQLTTKFDLTLSLEETASGLTGSLQYNTDLFAPESIARMVEHFRTMLQGIVDDPLERVSSLPLLTQAEQQTLLFEWDHTLSINEDPACVGELFEAQVERTPEAVAVVFETEQLTYAELNRRANQLAHHLQALGVGPEVVVAICLPRSLEMIVAVLATLKAGGAYLPLDPNYPPERLRFMLADAGAAVLLTHANLWPEPVPATEVVYLDTQEAQLSSRSAENPHRRVRVENLAYVIYTSGSTGRPKGVMIEQRAVVNLWRVLQQRIYDQQPTSLQVSVNAPLAFDSSVKQILQLLSGHTLQIIPEQLRLEPLAFQAYIVQHGLQVLDCTPSQLKLWLQSGLLQDAPSLKLLLVGGEEIELGTWEQLAQQSAIRCYNVYGPTECTVDATVSELAASPRQPAIGWPLANTQVYLLDQHLQPVPIGVAAELYIGGAGLARGYLQRPAVTAEKFIPHPFSTEPGARLYRTGDRARYLRDGQLEFLGRADEQVKIRGFRIELGEIEAALAQHPNVAETVVTVFEDQPDNKRLAAHVILKQPATLSSPQLRSFLKERLPDFMVPAYIVPLQAWPLTANGKLDRRSLVIPDHERPDHASEFVAPQTADEKMLATIWADLLGFEQVGVHDNFFDSGGHSLLATQLASRVRTAFQLELPLRAIFESPTISTLVEKIAAIRWQQETLAEFSAVSHGARETGEL